MRTVEVYVRVFCLPYTCHPLLYPSYIHPGCPASPHVLSQHLDGRAVFSLRFRGILFLLPGPLATVMHADLVWTSLSVVSWALKSLPTNCSVREALIPRRAGRNALPAFAGQLQDQDSAPPNPTMAPTSSVWMKVKCRKHHSLGRQ